MLVVNNCLCKVALWQPFASSTFAFSGAETASLACRDFCSED